MGIRQTDQGIFFVPYLKDYNNKTNKKFLIFRLLSVWDYRRTVAALRTVVA